MFVMLAPGVWCNVSVPTEISRVALGSGGVSSFLSGVGQWQHFSSFIRALCSRLATSGDDANRLRFNSEIRG